MIEADDGRLHAFELLAEEAEALRVPPGEYLATCVRGVRDRDGLTCTFEIRHEDGRKIGKIERRYPTEVTRA